MIGIVYALLSAALFGVSAPFAKMLLGAAWRSKEAGLSRRDLTLAGCRGAFGRRSRPGAAALWSS
jgi:hypothetical protein